MITEEVINLSKSPRLLGQAIEKNSRFIFQINSDSMSPLLNTGDIFSAEKISLENLRCGDIVVFIKDKNLIAHRFLKYQSPLDVMTKGDRSPQPDIPTPKSSIFAKVTKIKKGKKYIDLDNISWKAANFLIAKSALLGFSPSKHRGMISSFLNILIRIINPYFKNQSKDLYREKEIVYALSEINISDENIDLINKRICQNINWEYIYEIILYNSTCALAYHNLNQIKNEHIPNWFKDKLKVIYQESKSKASRLSTETESLLKAFQFADIQIILLKGSVMAQKIYPNQGLRPMQDVDILIKINDWLQIKNILKQQGFYSNDSIDLPELEKLSGLCLNWHINYKNQNNIKLEIKSSLFTLDFPDFNNVEEYWHKARQIMIGDQNTLTLSDEHHLVYLCTRMINVGFKHLLWFSELKSFIENCDINWQNIIEISRSKGVSPAVYFTLNILCDYFKAEIPEDILRQLKPPKIKSILFRLMFLPNYEVFRSSISIKRQPDPLIASYLLLNKPFARLFSYAFKVLFPPIKYTAYRYNIPVWQARIGKGYFLRIWMFIKKLSRVRFDVLT